MCLDACRRLFLTCAPRLRSPQASQQPVRTCADKELRDPHTSCASEAPVGIVERTYGNARRLPSRRSMMLTPCFSPPAARAMCVTTSSIVPHGLWWKRRSTPVLEIPRQPQRAATVRQILHRQGHCRSRVQCSPAVLLETLGKFGDTFSLVTSIAAADGSGRPRRDPSARVRAPPSAATSCTPLRAPRLPTAPFPLADNCSPLPIRCASMLTPGVVATLAHTFRVVPDEPRNAASPCRRGHACIGFQEQRSS